MGEKAAKSSSGPPPIQNIPINADTKTEDIVLNFANRLFEQVQNAGQPGLDQARDLFTSVGQPIQDIFTKLLQGELGATQVPIVARAIDENLRGQSQAADEINRFFSGGSGENFGRQRLQTGNINDFGIARSSIIPQALQQGITQFAPLVSDVGRLLLQRAGLDVSALQNAQNQSLEFNPIQQSKFEQSRELARQGNQQSVSSGGTAGIGGPIATALGVGGGLAAASLFPPAGAAAAGGGVAASGKGKKT